MLGGIETPRLNVTRVPLRSSPEAWGHYFLVGGDGLAHGTRCYCLPLQNNVRQDGGHSDGCPDHGLDANHPEPEKGRDRNDHPRHREDHGEWIAANHPATMLGDVAVPYTVEGDGGGQHPSERLHARSCS